MNSYSQGSFSQASVYVRLQRISFFPVCPCFLGFCSVVYKIFEFRYKILKKNLT